METEHTGRIQELKEILNKALLDDRPAVKHYLDLGDAYNESYKETHQQKDLESAIMYYNNGLKTDSMDRDLQWFLLNNLGLVLWTRHQELGDIKDLERAIQCHEQTLDLSPPGHPDRIFSLNNLGLVLRARYQQLGGLEDLEKGIIYYQQALELLPPGQPLRSISLNNLAAALEARYMQLGKMEDLEKAMTCHEQALDLRPSGHPNRPVSLNNLANTLKTMYEQLGGIEHLERAINYHREALNLWPLGNPLRSMSLNNLGIALHIRYDHLGEVQDLEKAITCHEQALDLRLPGHPDRPTSLSNLANSLHTRYQLIGGIEDLEKTINCCEQVLILLPSNHPLRISSLNNMANALRTRYMQLRELEDLEKGITCYQQALDLCPFGHPLRPSSLNNYATALQTRYEKLGKLEDLEKAIISREQAMDLHPSDYPNMAICLDGLANALQTRFEKLGKIEDLEKAIRYHEQVLNLLPASHPGRPLSLNNYSGTLHTRYKWLGEMEDLDKTITCLEQALDISPPGHPMRSSSLNNLAIALETRYMKLGKLDDLEMAITCHEQAASYITSSLPDRLVAAKQWASKAHRYKLSSAISAYFFALDLQQQHLALLPSIASQQKLVENSSWLALNAASCAISNGAPEMAVLLLEQGRSILWSKIEGYRHSFEEISEKAPQLSKEFQAVSKQLEDNITSNNVNITLQRVLSEKWKTVLGEIRKLDGFSDYLQVPSFKSLQHASTRGPVIMINLSQYRSDAIILAINSPPIVVPLHDASPQVLSQLVAQLSRATTRPDASKGAYHVLQHLWYAVVKPVVDQLAQLQVPEKSHIWWCPTSYLCALPLHAAGPYKKGFKNLPDLYISSYTPTLGSLIRARSNMPKPQSILNLLLISQPDDTVPSVFEEAKVITKFKQKVNSCSGQDADKKGVLAALQSHSWVHFACHGHLEEQPFNSWFQLYKKEHLTVLDLAMAKLPNAEFAFLSACHSAAGSIHSTPDEAIHLAGALQFSGFRSVIGTLWAMIDDDGPSIADAFYKYMFQNPDNVALGNAAAALNFATRELRKQNVPLDRWINFIHIGA